MTTSRSLRTSLATLVGAWLMAIPAFYLLYDFWMRGLDRWVTGGQLLRPYAFFVGICPLVLFWGGCVLATLEAAPALRRVSPPRATGLVVFLLGAVGSLLGAAAGVPTLAVVAAGLGRGVVPVGLLAVLGAASAVCIWAVRCLLGRLDQTAS